MRILSLIVALLTTASAEVGTLESVLNPEVYAKAKHALSHPGNAKRGKALFHNKTKLSCTVCHQIYGREIKKGAPNLFGIGDKFTPEDLIRAIELPSESVLPGFETTKIVTKSGKTHVGILRSVSTDSGYSLSDVAGKSQKIKFKDVADKDILDVSLMPPGLTAGLNKAEYADLIAFLMEQKTGLMSGVSAKDTSADIVILEKPVRLTPFFDEELSFVAPVFMRSLPGFDNQYVLLEHKAGKAWRLSKSADGDRKELFLDVSQEVHLSADGLTGIAFHPEFNTNRKYYIKKVVKEDGKLKSLITERIADASFLKDSGTPPRRLVEVKQPAGNHNGGCIQFGPDGYLYTAFGDGGPQKDPVGNSQNRNLFLGAMLRIDVDQSTESKPYGIPTDNPFIGQEDIEPEIWAIGFREPWQFSFDAPTGDLWVGDVGYERWEEVSIVRKGENHGWNVIEGFDRFSDEYLREGEEFTDPVFAYSRTLGTSITGGFVYRGDKNSPLYGYYICGDHESRRLFAFTQKDRKLGKIYELGFSPQRVSCFGVDDEGELFLVGYQGTVYRLELESIDLTPRNSH